MSNARISHENMLEMIRTLRQRRDEALEVAANSTYAVTFESVANAYELTLSSIHIWSNGAYGEPFDAD